MNKAQDFYNKFDHKLINDYVSGNVRIKTAIENLSNYIPNSTRNILDIGCGIGWSTHEFSNYFENSLVEGIDLSPVLIEKASVLFKNNNLSFQVLDVTRNLPRKKFDIVVMIDVYEHISKNDREGFHNSLKNLLENHGRLLLACPSKFHQNWLKRNNPEGLQPVDEDVDFEIVTQLSKDIGGEVIYFEYKRIWKDFDYFHAIIEINPQYGLGFPTSKPKLVIESETSRIKRVEEKLEIKVEPAQKKVQNKSFLNKIKNAGRNILRKNRP